VKKLLALIVGVAFAAGTAGLVTAQTPAPAPAPEKKMDKMEKSDKAGAKRMSSKHAKGTVKSTSADSLVVAGKEKGKDAEWTFAVDPKTTIKKGGKAITPGDVKSGDTVNVKYMEHDGKMTAQQVTVTAAPTAKKDDAMKKPAADSTAKPAEKK
jgi:hypothetical protein